MSEHLLLPHGTTLTFCHEGDVGTVSDGYHTFAELYEHRCLLFCLAVQHDRTAWKSRQHADGSMHEGWFIAGTYLMCLVEGHSELLPITYHLPLEMWDLCHAIERGTAPAWDGHTSLDVCKRLHAALKNV